MHSIFGVQVPKEFFGFPEPVVKGIVTSMMPIGALVGSFFSWYLVQSISPRWALQYGCFIWIFGCVLQAAVPAHSVISIGRGLAGVGAGIASAVVPVYQVLLTLPVKFWTMMMLLYS